MFQKVLDTASCFINTYYLFSSVMSYLQTEEVLGVKAIDCWWKISSKKDTYSPKADRTRHTKNGSVSHLFIPDEDTYCPNIQSFLVSVSCLVLVNTLPLEKVSHHEHYFEWTSFGVLFNARNRHWRGGVCHSWRLWLRKRNHIVQRKRCRHRHHQGRLWERQLKPVLNWANVCSPEHTSDTSTNYDSFLNWTFTSPNMVQTVQTLLHSQLACNEMQASARTCGRRAADSMIENVG